MDLGRQALDLHHSTYVIDGHSDIPINIYKKRLAGHNKVLEREHLPAWISAGINGAILTIAGDESSAAQPFQYANDSLKALEEDISESGDRIALASSPEELAHHMGDGRVGILLNIEGANPIEGSLEKLSHFFHCGVRYMTLTWNKGNEVGTGVGSVDASEGLSQFGERVVNKMAALGMVTDLSHASKKTFFDVVKLETGNIVATHSNAAGLHPHPRNLTDDQLLALAAQGGFVGICFYPGFLHSEHPTVDHIIDHIVYIGDLIGIEHVAIGADYIDFALEDIVAHLQNSGIDYGDNFTYPQGVETIDRLPNLTTRMLARGFDKGTIAKVLGENLLRVFRRIGAS